MGGRGRSHHAPLLINPFVVDPILKEAASRAAREAGRYILDHLGDVHEIRYKSEAINLVTEVDQASEAMIVKALEKASPGFGFLGEEMGQKGPTQGRRWIIDPLDGTTNYAHAFPFFCVSIGLEEKGAPILGIVYDPVRDELFSGSRGEGAQLNGKRIAVSQTTDIEKSLLATGFSYQVRKTGQNLDHFRNFMMVSQAVRRAGSAALDLCYLACGRFDGFWEFDLQPWDTVAASLIVEEAGGKVSDFQGRPYSHYQKEILASNKHLHSAMLQVLALKG